MSSNQKTPLEERDTQQLSRLEADIAAAKNRQHDTEKPEESAPSGAGMAWRVSTELLGGVIVGFGSGYLLDRWLDTSPLFLIACFMLGCAGSGLTIYRLVRRDSIQD